MKKVMCILAVLYSISSWAGLNPADYKNYIGAKACAECHEDEAAIWQHTHHFKNFKKMPRSKKGQAIARKMDVLRIKTSEQCAVCHTTFTLKEGQRRLKPVAGTACESCHGPAKQWNDRHHDYGGKHVKKHQESQAHKATRLAEAKKAGMITAADFPALFRGCYQCHSLNNEALINKTEHPSGKKFEVVAWSQGEIRHNVFTEKDKQNRIMSKPKQRVLYVVGQLYRLEYALQGLALASQDGDYVAKTRDKIDGAKQALTAIVNAVPILEVKESLALLDKTPLQWGQAVILKAAAKKIAGFSQSLAEKATGKAWQALDPLLPKKYKGKPTQ